MDHSNLQDRRLVLVISSLRRGGAEKIFSALANGLAQEGVPVVVITLEDSDSPSAYELDPRIERRFAGIARPTSHFAQALLSNFRGINRLRNLLRRENPEVLISFMGRTNIRVLIAAAGLKFPVVVSERTNPLRENSGMIWKLLRRWLYPHARFIVTPTLGAGNALRLRDASKIRVIPNAVETIRESTMRRDPVIVAMGRLISLKGFDILIEAFDSAVTRHPALFSGWSLRIYGEGPEEKGLQEIIRSRRAADRIFLCGPITEPIAMLQQAEIFVLPSRYEGFPNALCEAMVCGVAVVAADCDFGPSEILSDPRDGILFPVGNASALSDALVNLVAHPGTRTEYGRRAALAMDRFAPDKIFPLWKELLVEALAPESILVVAPSLRRGGAERAVSGLTREWSRDHAVTLAVFNGNERAYSFGGDWLDLGLPPARGAWRKLITAVGRVTVLMRILRRQRPDRIFVFMESANIPVMLAALCCGMHRRVTVSVRGNPDHMTGAHRVAAALLYGWAGRIAVVSRGVGARLAKRLPFGASRIRTLYSPLDIEGIRARAEANVPFDAPYFFAAGRLVPGKDFERMIRLFGTADCRDTHLLIAGEGPSRPNLEAAIREAGLEARVHLLGAIDPPYALMAHALAFLMTSRHEGFPMVLLESLACGTPFLAFDCEFGPREISAEGRAGVVVPRNDDEAFRIALQQLAGDPGLRAGLSAGARARAEDFAAAKSAAAWLVPEAVS